ncbi:MAG: molybdate ABC transporter substrate-binding protein [Planctomycetaceae bacterium]|nr:molybdate ABC transporter substrate-binding protein [Planctomycetaceae bacterium]MCB9953466.1 molybdate ABC transporter substrate-binding protein [Planctomycetaceae bacterium]
MNRPVLFILATGIIAVALLFLMRAETPSVDAEKTTVRLFCAASNRAVIEEIRADYEAECGEKVEIEYGPSQTLLTTIEVSGQGDLYLPADTTYLDMAEEKGLTEEVFPLADMHLVLCVPKGNPLGIKSFEDLFAPGVRIVQAEPDAAAVGRMTREILTESGQWNRLEEQTTATRSTVTEVASDVKLGAADVGIVYDAVLHTFPELEAVALPEFATGVAHVAVSVIKTSSHPTAAIKFARYAAAHDRGQKRYAEFSFTPANGDAWTETPEMTIYCGSMLRPAIEKTVAEFEQREGAKVTTVYNGCGILVAQMNAGQSPDAYFACDVEFMKQVQERFGSPTDVSTNELVILVKKGNPHGIQSLKDLGREGLRVGVGHEKQCAMGWLTQRTLTEGGLTDTVMPNVTVQTPTGDMLVNQLKAGSLDAAVAYISNAAGSAEDLDAIRIEGIPCSQATQPFAVAKASQHSQLAQRLFKRLNSKESQQRFLNEGFSWIAPGDAP